jgi:RimJ/RimL family protein N-acetyltransferase
MPALQNQMPPTPVLKTPRLVLRPVRTKDAPVIQRRFPQWEIVRWLDARVPWPYPADGAATHVAACLDEMAKGRKCHWAIVPNSGTADLIGMIELGPDDGSSRGQRGFWLDPAFQGRGLMSEAADRVTDWAFAKLDWPHLIVTNAQNNLASRRIKERQGARLIDMRMGRCVEGQVTSMVWQITRQDWFAREPVNHSAKREGRRLAATAFGSVPLGK